ncbi:hypothetical protein EPI10_015290 [Gossypium australe]|uniref:Uncharacterized protein n=1 Tax=Gossypium australe TaxID=47621 RepID=A0A5B6VK87_9ROSI|nr:hypothetical protein EPI10_015290 [Gossypium australe]
MTSLKSEPRNQSFQALACLRVVLNNRIVEEIHTKMKIDSTLQKVSVFCGLRKRGNDRSLTHHKNKMFSHDHIKARQATETWANQEVRATGLSRKGNCISYAVNARWMNTGLMRLLYFLTDSLNVGHGRYQANLLKSF